MANLVIAIVCAVTGMLHPIKCKYQNYDEQLIILNLQILYLLVFHHTNPVIANIVSITTAVHFTYMCGGVIRNKIQQGVSTVVGWIKNRSTVQNFQLANVPEVTFNYREHREPLVAED